MKKNLHLKWPNFLAFHILICVFNTNIFAQTSYTSTAINTAWNTARWNNSTDVAPYTSTYTANQPVYFTSGNYTIGGMGVATNNVGNITLANNVNVTITGGSTFNTNGAVRTLDIGTGSYLFFNGVAMSTAAGTGFIKNGSGAVDLGTSGSYPAGFTLNAGTVLIGGTNSLGGATFTINGGIILSNSASTQNATSPTAISVGGDFQLGDFANYPLNTGILTFSDPISLGASTRTITLGSATAFSFSSVFSGNAGTGLTIDANSGGTFGSLSLTGSNTYTGPTTINGGTLSINGINNGGGSGRLGASTSLASNLVFGGGTLSYTSGSSSTDRNFTITSGKTGTIEITTAGTTLSMNGAAASSTGSFIKTGPGSLRFNAANNYTGSTTISAGTIRIGASERINDASALSLAASTTFDLFGFNETVGSLAGTGGSITSSATGNLLFTAGGDNSSTSFAGTIINGSATSVAFTKEGSGTLELTGANTYTGLTNVNAGTLQLNKTGGALNANNSIDVKTGATLRISKNQTLNNLNLASGSTLTVDAGITLTITGTLDVNTGATISTTGTIAYATGVRALTYTGASTFNAGIEWPTAAVPQSVLVGPSAKVILTSDVTTTPSLTVDGVLNTKAFQVTGTGPTVIINGTLITERLQGFTGSSTTFTGISPTLGSSSIIEYAASSGTQIITTNPTYVNLTLSNGGTKTAASALDISNNLTIKDATIFDANNSTIGGNTTNLIMTDNSLFKTGGTGNKPDAGGTYTLANTTTIEFINSAGTQQDIKFAPTYANINISGTNVGLTNTTATLTLQSGTTFTVKNGGTFNVQNLNGFSGGAATAVGNTNNPTIALETNSTINYNATANQVITTGAVSITPPASNYYNLRISGSGNKTAPSGNLIVAGDITSAGTAVYVHNNGTLVTNGTAAQSYTASTPFSLYKFVNNNASVSGLTINSNLTIEKEMTLGSASKINLTAGEVILKSDLNATAALTAVPNDATINYGSGKFNIQRYMPGVKAWRLLATPVDIATSPTITDSWREGGTGLTSTGFGTRITGPGAGGAGGTYGTGANYDEYTPNGNMKSYNMSTNTFTAITENDLITGKKIANTEGYFLFVRGDRGVTTAAASGTPTTLQIKGQVRTGDQTFSVDPNKYSSIGNPYPSRLDMRSVNFNSVTESFYVWNPSATGLFNVGAYENYTKVGADFIKIPGFTVMNNIESGQAFIVQNNTGSISNVVIPDASKTIGSANVSRVGLTIPTLEINLHTNDASGLDYLADGAMLNFDNGYSNGFDEKDVKKVTNSYDNVGIKSNNQNLVVERRKALVETDTIRLNISGMRTANYSFEFDPSVLSSTGLIGYLKDKYLQTETEISLSTTTNVAFTITSDAASKAADRFMIVFRGIAGTLPVRFIDIAATKNNDKTHTIKWTIANEINIARYEIERSDRGTSFVSIGNTAAVQSTSYSHVDAMPFANDNYYRVKAISTTGEIQYSAIVKLTAKATEPLATIYPNPITDKVLKIQLANQAYGKYNITITNNAGQVIEKQTINLQSNITITNIYLKTAKAGMYFANITNSTGYKNILPFEIK